MKRREFMLLGGAAAAWPLATVAEQSLKPVIGFLGVESANSYELRLRAFRRGLSETGHIEGQIIDRVSLGGGPTRSISSATC